MKCGRTLVFLLLIVYNEGGKRSEVGQKGMAAESKDPARAFLYNGEKRLHDTTVKTADRSLPGEEAK